MLIAGSLIALLMVGFAADSFFSSDDEDTVNSGSDDASDDSNPEGPVETMSIAEFLFPPAEISDPTDIGTTSLSEPSAFDAAALRVGYTPLDSVDNGQERPLDQDQLEVAADVEWRDIASADTFDINETPDHPQDDIPVVEGFDPRSDALVLEFDGTDRDRPEIGLSYDSRLGGTVVSSNGLPITFVTGDSVLSEDVIRVLMRDDWDAPLVLSDPLVSSDVDPREINDPPILPTTHDLLETFVDTVSDGLPDAATIETLFTETAESLSGLQGTHDALTARAAIDPIFGTGGNDAITGTPFDDQVTGSDLQEALFGDGGDDMLDAGAGNDEVYGDVGNDSLAGDSGNDFLDGGDGNDTLDGGADSDLLFGADGDDVVQGGAADDFLSGGLGSDYLNGGSGNDTLNGTVSRTGLSDNDGQDTLIGGSGDDLLVVGSGDMAVGGDGTDTFVTGSFVSAGAAPGEITDFNPSQDVIEVLYDPANTPNPLIGTEPFSSGTGTNITLNGEIILSIPGAADLSPTLITLRAVA